MVLAGMEKKRIAVNVERPWKGPRATHDYWGPPAPRHLTAAFTSRHPRAEA